MAAEAKVSSSWMMRIGLITLMGFGALGWGAWDGFVAYPKANEIAQAYIKDYVDNADGWAEFARSKGWSPKLPKIGRAQDGGPAVPHGMGDFLSCYVFIGVGILVGLAGAGVLLSNMSKTVSSDEEGFAVGSTKVPYSAVKSINKARWDDKAIAVVHYEQNGKSGSVKIDDWKFKGADAVLADVEQHTGLGGGDEPSEPAEKAEG